MAKLLAVCFVAILTIAAAQDKPEYVSGTPDQPAAGNRAMTRAGETATTAAPGGGDSTTAAPAEEAKCKKGTAGNLCADCSKLLVCDGKNEEPLAELVCSEQSPENPYCVKTECKAEADPNDPNCKKASDVDCTFEGYLPDPKNCTKYYYCDKVGGDATPYSCPVQYVYDQNSTMCKLKKTEADCATMKCTGKPFVTYAPDKSIYGFCDPKTNKTTVFRCEDEVNEWFNEKTLSCGIICRKSGPFADRRDCKKYYVCYVVNRKWKLDHVDCPNGLHYDTDQKKCVKGADCTPEITTEAAGDSTTAASGGGEATTNASA